MERLTDVSRPARMLPLSEVHTALAEAMIRMRYQPIVRMLDREPLALEALARLHHPTLGTLLPGRFVPQIEGAGLAPRLTEIVAHQVFDEMGGPALAPHHLDIALNFPLDVLLVPDSVRMLDEERLAAGIPATQVIVELTESQPVDDVAALGRATERLRSSGYRVVIDDVEPGIARLDALLDLPFHGVKLDKDVVQGLGTCAAAHDFTQRLIAMAKRRGLITIAEGVEDVATWRMLARLGIDLAQGFFLARPLLATSVPLWLRRWSKRRNFS